jgi:hypothetical protein
VEAYKLLTIEDRLRSLDERVELIDGEIVSPGHERKDTLQLPLLLRRHRVPYYWLIWPEDRVLIAHALDARAPSRVKGPGSSSFPGKRIRASARHRCRGNWPAHQGRAPL